MTATLKIKNERYYAVINYKEGNEYKQKWISLNLPVKNNKRKACEMLSEIEAKYREIYETASQDIKFVTYIKRWLEAKKATIELSTWEGYKIYAEKHIIPYFEPLKLSLRDVRPSHIQDYYQYKFTGGRKDGKPGGLSTPSIKKHSIVIKEVLRDAVLHELIPRNPADGVKLPTRNAPVKEKVFLTAEQANVLLRCFEGHPLQALIYVTLYYGLRRSEALGLRWSAIDFERNTLTINHTVVKNLTIVEKDSVKTQSSYHTYALIDDVKDVLLKEYNNRVNIALEFKKVIRKDDYVFTWYDGTPFRPDYVTRAFQRVLKANGLPKMRFHDLRHSTASILYDKGWSLKDIQIWLRHSSIDVTSDIYTHISENRKQSMAKELNSTFTIK